MTARPSKATDRRAPLGRSALPTWSIRYRKTTRLARQLYAARVDVTGGTALLIRTRAPRVNVKAKTNAVNENLVTGSLNTIAMTRGVSCELASCTETMSAEETKTMNVNIDAAMVPSTARAVSGWKLDSQPSTCSLQWSNRTAPSAARMLIDGRIQIEF